MVREPANFISSIANDRGEELKYCGVTITGVFEKDMGLGGELSLLWFRRQLLILALPGGPPQAEP